MTMAVELKLLGVAVIIGLTQMLWAAAAARRQQGLKWAAGSRDEPRPIAGAAARLDRAFANFKETFVFFAVIVVALAFAGKSSELSRWGADIYLAARIFYIPLYAFGVVGVRSLAWIVSLIGILMCLFTLFF